MDYKAAIRHMLDKADKSGYRASLDMGRSSRYLSMVLQTADIKLSTLQEISSLCGYRITLTSADSADSIVLDTTRQDS